MPQHNRDKSKKDLITLIVLSVIFAVLIGWDKYLDYSLHKHLVTVNGTVSDPGSGAKRSRFVYYNFTVQGKLYTGSAFLPAFKDVSDRKLIIGRQFPVAVDSTIYGNNIILFDSVAFHEYQLAYPDSLRWLGQYLK